MGLTNLSARDIPDRNIVSRDVSNSKSTDLILCIIQLVAIYNAIVYGWKVTRIGNKKFELSKKVDKIENFDLDRFLDEIISIC